MAEARQARVGYSAAIRAVVGCFKPSLQRSGGGNAIGRLRVDGEEAMLWREPFSGPVDDLPVA